MCGCVAASARQPASLHAAWACCVPAQFCVSRAGSSTNKRGCAWAPKSRVCGAHCLHRGNFPQASELGQCCFMFYVAALRSSLLLLLLGCSISFRVVPTQTRNGWQWLCSAHTRVMLCRWPAAGVCCTRGHAPNPCVLIVAVALSCPQAMCTVQPR